MSVSPSEIRSDTLRTPLELNPDPLTPAGVTSLKSGSRSGDPLWRILRAPSGESSPRHVRGGAARPGEFTRRGWGGGGGGAICYALLLDLRENGNWWSCYTFPFYSHHLILLFLIFHNFLFGYTFFSYKKYCFLYFLYYLKSQHKNIHMINLPRQQVACAIPQPRRTRRQATRATGRIPLIVSLTFTTPCS